MSSRGDVEDGGLSMNDMWGLAASLERGEAMVEYSLVVALIAVVSLLVVGALGMDVFGFFDAGQLGLPGSGPLPAGP